MEGLSFPCLVEILYVVPSTVTGTVKVPFLVVRDVVAVNVMTGAVVPLEALVVV